MIWFIVIFSAVPDFHDSWGPTLKLPYDVHYLIFSSGSTLLTVGVVSKRGVVGRLWYGVINWHEHRTIWVRITTVMR